MNRETILDIVDQIQYDIYTSSGECEELELILTSNGDMIIIEYLGIRIWHSEDDERKEIDPFTGQLEDLENYLRERIAAWNKKIGSIKLPME